MFYYTIMSEGSKSFLKTILRKLLPARAFNALKSTVHFFKRKRFLWRFKKKITVVHQQQGNAVIILATPVHGNLGDHAIVYAEQRLLSDMGLGKRIIEVAGPDYALCKDGIREYVSDKDLILIDGGGNLGTLWPWEDDKITEIIASYRQNPVVVFPQTCFYDDNQAAVKRMERNRLVYSKADCLLITLRDAKSYDFCSAHFPGIQCSLTPDIVLYLWGELNQTAPAERNGVLLCFRKDLERMISQEDVMVLQTYLKRQNLTYKEISTVKDYGIDRFSRHAELNKIWSEFASARLVITDRLHGMIFAIITGTPCLALDNLSRKVSGVYELLPELDYVKICSCIDEVIKHMSTYYTWKPSRVVDDFQENNYQILKNFIKENIQD